MVARKQNLTVGLLVNPYAGIGGPSGQKGSDHLDSHSQQALKALFSRSLERAHIFLDTLASSFFAHHDHDSAPLCDSLKPLTLLFCEGEMGGESVRRVLSSNPQAHRVFDCVDINGSSSPSMSSSPSISSSLPTTSADSRRVVKSMIDRGIDILVFVGGDGTARDVFDAVSCDQLVLGVPAGVKMHSGVFAIDSRCAAEVLMAICKGELVSTGLAQVRDIDEDLLRQGRVNTQFYGELRIPEQHEFIQSVKQGGLEVEELVLLDLAEEIRERIETCLAVDHNLMVIFAPGTTCHFIAQELGLASTLLGFDVMLHGELVACDVDALELEDLLSHHTGDIRLVITPIGGQGHVIGRGNQQLTPRILRTIGRDRLWLVSTKTKLAALQQRPLNIDSNDPLLDQQWSGLIPVITGFHDDVIYRIGLWRE